MNIDEDDSPWLEDDTYDHHQPVASTSSSSHQSFAAGDGSTSQRPFRNHDQLVAEQEWSKLSSRYTDEGYRAGILHGKEAKLQTGFNEGYALAAPYARSLGRLRAISAGLLSLLTTTSGSKWSPVSISDLSPDRKDEFVVRCRELVGLLGKVQEKDVVPVDLEAEEHRKEHEGGNHEGVGENLALADKRDMDGIEEMMGTLGSTKKPTNDKVGLDECEAKLQALLQDCGLSSLAE